MLEKIPGKKKYIKINEIALNVICTARRCPKTTGLFALKEQKCGE